MLLDSEIPQMIRQFILASLDSFLIKSQIIMEMLTALYLGPNFPPPLTLFVTAILLAEM